MKKWKRNMLITVSGVISSLVVAYVVYLTVSFIYFWILFAGRPTQQEMKNLAQNFDRENEVWEECTIDIQGEDVKLFFLQRRIHPYLVEYEYSARIERDSVSVTKWLWESPGGRTDVSVYLYERVNDFGPVIHFRGNSGYTYLRIDTLTPYSATSWRHDKVYFAEILGYNSFSDERIDFTDTPINQREPDLIGNIDGKTGMLRFIAADSQKSSINPNNEN